MVRNFKYFHCDSAINEDDIKHQYKSLVKKYHPDKATTVAESEEFHRITNEINEEYSEIQVLLKYGVSDLSSPKPKPLGIANTLKDMFSAPVIKEVAELFLNKTQQEEIKDMGKQMLVFLYSSVMDNLKTKSGAG